MKIQSDLQFDPQLLGFLVVMNGIGQGGSPYVLSPPSLGHEEQTLCNCVISELTLQSTLH